MKRKVVAAGSLLVTAALAFTGYAPAQNKGAASSSATKITVHNPAIASKMAERAPLSPRLDTLDGKTLYFVDINWGGPEAAYSVFEEMQAWLAANKPTVKTVIRRLKGSYSQDDPGLWKEIAGNGNAAVIGISG